jgi:hypothetical protein
VLRGGGFTGGELVNKGGGLGVACFNESILLGVVGETRVCFLYLAILDEPLGVGEVE